MSTAVRHLTPLRKRSPMRLIGFGFLSWLPVFAATSSVVRLRDLDFPVFLAVAVVAMAASTTLFTFAYLREAAPPTLRHGFVAGITWAAIHLLLGFIAFVGGPLEMPVERFRALAVCTLLIPTITIALAYQSSRRRPAA
jgi:hypothetical protein